MLKTTLQILFALLVAALMVIAPNALWQSRSSALVSNSGAEAMTPLLVITGESDRFIEAGVLAPGASRFLRIDPVGEATLAAHPDFGNIKGRGKHTRVRLLRTITRRNPVERRAQCTTFGTFLAVVIAGFAGNETCGTLHAHAVFI